MKKTAILVGALLAISLVGVNPSRAQGSSIEFLNPSGYTSEEEPPVLSAKQDADNTYHLVAWVRNIPASPLVEFELRRLPTGNTTTVEATRAGNAFEAGLPLAGLADGPYELKAILFSNLDEVDTAQMTVNVTTEQLPPPPANTVEILNPENGEQAGYFAPEGKAPGFLLSTLVSEDTERVRVLYSMSDPGNQPEWKQCGFGTPDDNLVAQVRCALASGDSPAEVTALAAVANKTPPPGSPPAAADDTGDAHAITPYLQQARTVDISPTTGSGDVGVCQKFTLTVSDQLDQPIAGINVDVHAAGPGDQIQFATFDTTPVTNDTDPFQAPDRGGASHRHSTENAIRCSDDESLGQQGETNVPGGDDVKHVESTAPANSLGGTDNFGRWVFALHSRTQGGTQIVGWADVNGDDVLALSEASGGAQFGWGVPPPQPVTEVFVSPTETNASTGSCVPFEVQVRRGGNPFGGANVDVHVTGPDSSVTFCDTSGTSTRRPPESGGHVADAHEDGTRHAEGEASSDGRFVFGVTSATQGTSSVQIWLDDEDDDVSSGDLSRTATVTWQPPGDRDVSLTSNKNRVSKGRRVRLSGTVQGDPACAAGQTIQLQSKRLRGGTYRTIRTLTTDAEGEFATRVRMRSARKFRAIAPAAEPCQQATSPAVTVRVS